jgi:hypothetical protein
MRTFPLAPRSVADLEIGDFFCVPRVRGGLAVLQVRDLSRSGPGARTAFVVGVIDWQGDNPPTTAELRDCRVLAQGLTRIEVFTNGGATVLGNTMETRPVEGTTSTFRDFGVGTKTAVWGWKALGRRADVVLSRA